MKFGARNMEQGAWGMSSVLSTQTAGPQDLKTERSDRPQDLKTSDGAPPAGRQTFRPYF